MSTLFISDLHLSPQRPKITQLFVHFMQTRASQAEALYILGDFFDSWIGDDAATCNFSETVFSALKHVTDNGVPVYLMPGNRDFLYGKALVTKTGVTLIADPLLINLYGTPTLLMHGDSLCTQDKAYQRFRLFVRNRFVRWLFLHCPLSFRKKFAANLRKKSQQGNQQKLPEIMDVEQNTVEKTMRQFKITHLIHGHTHKPNVHHFSIADKKATRTVLGAWEHDGNVLVCTPDEQRYEKLPL